jgi:hypothetical protein
MGDADIHTAAQALLDAWEWQPGQPLGQPGTVAKRIMDAVEALRAALAAGPAPDPQGTDEPADDEDALRKALAPFGWTCGPEFWQRYYRDPWVFHLANAVERLTRRAAAVGALDEPTDDDDDQEPTDA